FPNRNSKFVMNKSRSKIAYYIAGSQIPASRKQEPRFASCFLLSVSCCSFPARLKPVPLACAGLLLGGRRGLRNAARTPRGALLAFVRKLLLALQLFVEANGLILDDRVLHAQPSLQFVHQFAVVRPHLVVDVDAFAVLGHLVGQLARAPVLGLLDLAAFFG